MTTCCLCLHGGGQTRRIRLTAWQRGGRQGRCNSHWLYISSGGRTGSPIRTAHWHTFRSTLLSTFLSHGLAGGIRAGRLGCGVLRGRVAHLSTGLGRREGSTRGGRDSTGGVGSRSNRVAVQARGRQLGLRETRGRLARCGRCDRHVSSKVAGLHACFLNGSLHAARRTVHPLLRNKSLHSSASASTGTGTGSGSGDTGIGVPRSRGLDGCLLGRRGLAGGGGGRAEVGTTGSRRGSCSRS